jgi:hypothetical protein
MKYIAYGIAIVGALILLGQATMLFLYLAAYTFLAVCALSAIVIPFLWLGWRREKCAQKADYYEEPSGP